MAGRMEALERIWAFIWVNTAGYLIAIVASILGLVLGTLDVFLQLLTGWEVLSSRGLGLGFVGRAFSWVSELLVFSLTGQGSFSWWP